MHTLRVVRTQVVVGADGAVARRKPVTGDMRWDGKAWKRWSGRRWSRAAYSLRPERLADAAPFHHEPAISEARRDRALALAVEDQVTNNGATLAWEGPHGVVLSYRVRVAHFFHAVMTVLTAGLWAVVWIPTALGRRDDRVRLEVDRWGNVWARQVASA